MKASPSRKPCGVGLRKRAGGARPARLWQDGDGSWRARTMTMRGRLRVLILGLIGVGLLFAAAVLIYVIAFGPTR